ncbi:hypothetical protein HOD20_02270 [archaeon]|jgi:hypothetical protein|nr:hypothetical protein [archaeon]MBT4647004.1 hypothetical protein [archaeon]MBT6822474.1 hypothetical protein [archaeon]MBT7392003.1 hypothetical protein [archaeon]
MILETFIIVTISIIIVKKTSEGWKVLKNGKSDTPLSDNESELVSAAMAKHSRETHQNRRNQNYISSELSSLLEYSDTTTDPSGNLSSFLEEKVTGIDKTLYDNKTIGDLIKDTGKNYEKARFWMFNSPKSYTTQLGLQTIVDYAMMNLQGKDEVSKIEDRLYVGKYFEYEKPFFKGYDKSKKDIRKPIIREYVESLRDKIIEGEEADEAKVQLRNFTLLVNAYSQDLVSKKETNKVIDVAQKIEAEYFYGPFPGQVPRNNH